MTKRLRVLVCGSRDWEDRPLIYSKLDDIWGWQHSLVIIEGGCRGADVIAGLWASEMIIADHDVEHYTFKANWARYGKAAGPVRNQRMLDHGHPDMVLAFHDHLKASTGTSHMVKIARAAGLSTTVIGHHLDASPPTPQTTPLRAMQAAV